MDNEEENNKSKDFGLSAFISTVRKAGKRIILNKNNEYKEML